MQSNEIIIIKKKEKRKKIKGSHNNASDDAQPCRGARGGVGGSQIRDAVHEKPPARLSSAAVPILAMASECDRDGRQRVTGYSTSFFWLVVVD